MKTDKTMFFLMALFVSSISLNAQNSYKEERSYDGGINGTSGIETVTYTANADGDNILNGPYSFVGKRDIDQTTLKFHSTYTIHTQVKNEKINGTYTQKANYVYKDWNYTYGWRTWTASSSLTGTFKNGEPDGLFSFTHKDNINDDSIDKSSTYRSNICNKSFSGSVTIKNGKIIGPVNWYGWKETHDRSEDKYYSRYFSGQLTSDYKFTGTWRCGISPNDASTLTFINNVLINDASSGGQTPVVIQNLAKQYAAGKLTEAQLLKKGYMIAHDTLFLTSAIISTLNSDEFGLTQCPAKHTFDNMKEPGYIFIKEVPRDPKFTKEGFKIWLNAVRTQTPFEGDWDLSYKLIPILKDSVYYVWCGEKFARKYAGCNQEGSQHVPLTKEQEQQYLVVRDSIWKCEAKPFSSYIEYNYHYTRDKILALYNRYEAGKETLFIDLCAEMPKLKQYGFYGRDWNDMVRLINGVRETDNKKFEYTADKKCFYTGMNIYINDFYKFDSIADIMSRAEDAYLQFDKDWRTIYSNDNDIRTLCKPYKAIKKDYITYCNENMYYPHTEYTGYASCLFAKEVLKKQQEYKSAINTYIEQRKTIKDNNAQILSNGKPYKQLLKVYQTYFKSVDLTWTGLAPNTTIEQVIKNQEIIKKAFQNSHMDAIEAEVKVSDKTFDSALQIIDKHQ